MKFCIWDGGDGELIIDPKSVAPSGFVINSEPLLLPRRVESHVGEEQSYIYHYKGLLLEDEFVCV